MKRVFPVSALSSRRLLFSTCLLLALPMSIWAIVGPAANDRLDEAARLYSRVEELWRAKASGDTAKTASMMVPASRERLASQSNLPVSGAVSGPVISHFLVEAVTINREGNLAKAEISFSLGIPGAPVFIPQEQAEIWEKIDSEWYFGVQDAMQQYLDTAVTGGVDVGTTEIVDAGTTSVVNREESKNPLAADVSERFDRRRIAAHWTSQAIQLLDSGRKDEALKLLNDAIRAGAPDIWERLIVAERLIESDIWRQIVPETKDELLELIPVLERLGKQPEAARILEQSLTENTNDARLLEKLGDIYSAMGEVEKAIQSFVKTIPATAHSDDIHRVQWKLGQEYFSAGRYRDAVNALAGAAATDPMAKTLRPVLSLLADALLADKDFEHALAVYKVVCAFASAPPSAVLGRIRAALALNDLDEVLRCAWLADTSNKEVSQELLSCWPKLKGHLKRRGKDGENGYTLGVVAESLGDIKEAHKAFQEGISSEGANAGSTVHLCADDMPSPDSERLKERLHFLDKRFSVRSEADLRSLANAISRAPELARNDRQSPEKMHLLFSDGNLSRVILVSGKDREDVFAGAAGIGCVDGTTIALDVGESGPYFLSFDIKPCGLQSKFEPVIVTLLDGEPLDVLPLQLVGRRFGKVLRLSAGLHSLEFVFDVFSLTVQSGAAEYGQRRFLLSHASLIPVSELRAGVVGDTGQCSPVEIVSVSGGEYYGPIGDVFVDGVQVSCQMSGYNAVALEPKNGAIIDSINLATAADRDAEARLKALVDSPGPSTIVAVSVFGDGAYRADKTITQSLEALGGQNSLVQESSWDEEISRTAGVQPQLNGRETRGTLFPARFRHSYALIGAKGAKKGSALEATGWENTAVAVTSEHEKTRLFLEALSPCQQEHWSECAQRLTSFFTDAGNQAFVKRLPLGNSTFVEHVVPAIQSADPELFLALGRRLEECSQPNEALAAYDRSLAVSENLSAYFAKAVLFARTRDFNSAYKTYMSGIAVSPILKLTRLKEIVKDVKTSGVQTILVTASNGASCHYINGMRTAFGIDAWTLSGVEPESGKLLASKTVSKDDATALARAIDALPEGTIVVLAFSGETPVKITTSLANAIQGCIRRDFPAHKAYKNLVLVGCRSEKPMGFQSDSYYEASLLATWD
ncbi:MAG: tetratricopeptide repeat protein [Candidatus Coatesbacteria bacterium]|nr:tetratricopeptide repeat protein [Candidatus Coatesbacteria bacterium]